MLSFHKIEKVKYLRDICIERYESADNSEYKEIILLCNQILRGDIDEKYFCNHLQIVRIGLELYPFVQWLENRVLDE